MKNIDYWKQITINPPIKYRNFFDTEITAIKDLIQENDSVLDIGVGEGRYFDLIKNTLKAKKYVGVDIEPKTNNYFHIYQGTSDDLPFEDNSFNKVLLLSTFYNLASKKIETLLEIKRVLTIDGSLILSTYSEHALEERLRIYKKLSIPIEKVTENGTVIFKKKLGANISEQFSIQQITDLLKSVDLYIEKIYEVKDFAYILEIKRVILKNKKI